MKGGRPLRTASCGDERRIPLHERPRFYDAIFFAGIAIRLLVYARLSPFNNDGAGHLQHLLYIKEFGEIPPAGFGHETFQPPLYYILAAALAAVSENRKFLQAFSLLTSVAALFVARRLILSATVLRTRESRLFALLIVSLLPQFVMFSLYLSNDSLAVLLGFVVFYLADRFFASATAMNFLHLVIALALGLLTKGQFLVMAAIVFPPACFLLFRRRSHSSSRLVLVCILALLVLALGCVKYFQNAVLYGRPFVSNLDFNPGWLAGQQGTYRGLSSIFDVNIFKLIRTPILDESTVHSIPLVLYGTFWYQYIPESNFRGNLSPGPRMIGRFMDLVGVLPALVLAIGVIAVPLRLLEDRRPALPRAAAGTLLRSFAAAAFAANLALLLYELSLFDNWSTLQARSLFPSILGGFVLFDLGIETLARRIDTPRVFKFWHYAFLAGVAAYYAVEIVSASPR
jgi:hypothetical protein